MAKVIVSPAPAKITRERRKLKGYKRLFDKGKLTEEEVLNSYMSWRQSITKDCSCYRSVKNLDALYEQLFGKSPLEQKPKSNKTRYNIPDAPGVKHFIQIKGGNRYEVL